MQITFEKLQQNYVDLISKAAIVPAREGTLVEACKHLLQEKTLYQQIEAKTGVPTAALMALAEREMDGDVHCYLGNGQPLTHRTTIVPKGRGPFKNSPAGFVAGALDALKLDGLDQVAKAPGGWSLARFCYESEAWNGWGYRDRGLPSPYVFGATTVQQRGKYVRDGVWSSSTMDPQLGTLAIVEELFKQDATLKFADVIQKTETPAPVVVEPHPIIAATNMKWVQLSLNKLRMPGTPLVVDGNCGRGTRAVVRAFQKQRKLVVDGNPGPKVVAALTQALAEAGLS